MSSNAVSFRNIVVKTIGTGLPYRVYNIMPKSLKFEIQ